MRREILHGADFCAVTEDGRLVEYIPLEDGAGQSRGGDIVLGKAERMMPGLACAFVDIGRRRSGFLLLFHSHRRSLLRLVGKRRQILDYLKEIDIERYRKIVKELGLRR